jgi:hypothetical protein
LCTDAISTSAILKLVFSVPDAASQLLDATFQITHVLPIAAGSDFTYCKVNHVTTEETQQSQDVILGMFLANSHPAIVLFDSGAWHSFIASKFVAKHNLPITIMKYTMIISSPRGEMKTKYIYLAISIAIRG